MIRQRWKWENSEDNRHLVGRIGIELILYGFVHLRISSIKYQVLQL